MGDTGSAALSEAYDERYSAGEQDVQRSAAWRSLCARNKADHVVALVRWASRPPVTVVEVGCGDGVLLAELAGRGVGAEHHGFDLSGRAVGFAAGRPEIARAERFDGSVLPVPDDAYDLGVLSHVLEHVPDPGPLLAETARVARTVVVEVPLEANRSASRSAAQRGRVELGHLHRFARCDIRALARAAGLHVVDELADPLPRSIHLFHAAGAPARVRGLAKAGLRRALFAASPGLAERSFTVHYACLLARS
jgi:SAM-dependent methyltransferase